MNTTIRPVSRASVLTMLNSMSWNDRRWISRHLSKQVARENASKKREEEVSSVNLAEEDNARLDAALAKFSGDWGGTESALNIARELRQGVEMVREVDEW